MASKPKTKARVAEVVQVPLGPLAKLGAAAFLAVLAYPAPCDYPKRTRFVEATKKCLLHRAVAAGYSRKRVLPKYRGYRRERIDRTFNPALVRIEGRRLPAAGIARHILLETWIKTSARPLPILRTIRVSTVNDLISRICPVGSIYDNRPHLFERVWSESKPVLHLAMAFLGHEPRLYQEERPSPSGLRRIWIDPVKLICRPDWLDPVLKSAEVLRLHFLPLLPLGRYQSEAAIQVVPEP